MADGLLLLAFGAGVIGFFAPCSIAMLPAYIGYFVGQRGLDIGQEGGTSRFKAAFGGLGVLVAASGLGIVLWAVSSLQAVSVGATRLSGFQVVALVLGSIVLLAGFYLAAPRGGVLGGLAFGLITTLGLLAAYLVMGLAFVTVFGFISLAQMAWAAVGIGGLLVLLGVLGFLGWGVSVTVPVHAPKKRSAVGFFLFGIAYGVVSLGCNLPLIGLPVVASIAGQGGLVAGATAFLVYGAGAGLLMIVLSVSVAASRGLTADRVRQLMPLIKPVTNAVFILAGLYVIWYAYTNLLLPTF